MVGIARLEQFEAPLAGAAAEVDDGGGGDLGEVGLEVVPGDAVVEVPVGIVVDRSHTGGDAVVETAVGFVGIAAGHGHPLGWGLPKRDS